jgi:hypothetical protein
LSASSSFLHEDVPTSIEAANDIITASAIKFLNKFFFINVISFSSPYSFGVSDTPCFNDFSAIKIVSGGFFKNYTNKKNMPLKKKA